MKKFNKKVGKHKIRECVVQHSTKNLTLDLGSGEGIYGNFFPNSIKVDIINNKKINIIADAQFLPFKNNIFPCVIFSEVLEHIRDCEIAMKEIERVTKLGGTLILTVPFVYPLHEGPNDYQRFTEYGLINLLSKTVFEIIQIKPIFTEFETIAIILQRIAFQTNCSKIIQQLLNILAHIIFKINIDLGTRYQN